MNPLIAFPCSSLLLLPVATVPPPQAMVEHGVLERPDATQGAGGARLLRVTIGSASPSAPGPARPR
ncbi:MULTISPECIES: arsenite efflux pump ArsB [Cupriavidus]|uniref:arsenite efflux pump ArsB n=1 Tax=Cupriavidus TaxID=106589 RepID=UPI0012EA467D|nr:MULTISPECIES: arsenite efflux pump ArsB [Cupriavidus]